MKIIIEQLTSNPIYLVIGGILAIFLIIGLVKRSLKLIGYLAIAVIAFVAHLYIGGREIPTADELKNTVIDQVDKAKE